MLYPLKRSPLIKRGGVQLASVPGFLAKNQVPNTSRHPVIIPSLSATVDKTFPDRTLCPVRELKFYVDRTRRPTVRRGRQHLFISYVEGYSKEIAPATISRWIISTISSLETLNHY
jgi:hypothetical protein